MAHKFTVCRRRPRMRFFVQSMFFKTITMNRIYYLNLSCLFFIYLFTRNSAFRYSFFSGSAFICFEFHITVALLLLSISFFALKFYTFLVTFVFLFLFEVLLWICIYIYRYCCWYVISFFQYLFLISFMFYHCCWYVISFF